MQPVAQHCRQRAGGTIGWRGHHAPAGGVLLVDRHGVDRQPVIGEQGIGPVLLPLLLQLVVQLARAAAHLQPARHYAVLRQAAIDAALHGAPDRVEAGVELIARHVFFLVDALHLGDRKPALGRHGQHLHGVLERIRHFLAFRCHRALGLHALQFFLGDDETAADRIIDALE